MTGGRDRGSVQPSTADRRGAETSSGHPRLRKTPQPLPAANADRVNDRRPITKTVKPVEKLGERIRQARVERGMGVRELARKVNCSASMISQIEGGTTNPSVSTLYGISTALGISTDSLIIGSPPPSRSASEIPTSATGTGITKGRRVTRGRVGPSIVLHPADRRMINLERGVRWELLMPIPESNAEFMEVTYEVGGGSTAEDHAIRHNGREYSLILTGELSVQIGFEQFVLQAGDSMAFDSTVPHRFWNAGNSPVRAIWFVIDRWTGMSSA